MNRQRSCQLGEKKVTNSPPVLVIDYKLTYPSGTATAVLINGFHTPRGEENAKYGTEFTLC
jgi:hypothetical protein